MGDNQTVIIAAELELKSRPLAKSVTFPDVKSTGSDVNESSAKEQAVLKVAATGNFDATDYALGWRIIIGRGTAREEECTITSISAGVSITMDENLIYNHTVTQEQTLDQESAAAQKNVYITATANLLVGETVVISAGEAEEESGVIASVNANDYITLVDVLANTHAIGRKCKHTAPTGISVVEVLWAGVSEVIVKKHHKKLCLFLPSTWITAGITFLGCATEDGTYIQVVKATDVVELPIASVAASKCIGLDGIVMQGIEAIPYLKLRSGVAATEVDQYNDAEIDYILMR